MRPQVTTLKTAAKSATTRRRFLAVAMAAGTAGVLASAQPGLAQSTRQKGYEIMQADQAHAAAKSGEIILVDIRTPQEWQQTGIGDGAIALDMRDADFVKSLVALRQKYEDKPIALICRTGNRSGYVVSTLTDQGFPGLVDVAEGMAGGPNGTGWINRGLPVYPGSPAEIQPRLDAVLGD